MLKYWFVAKSRCIDESTSAAEALLLLKIPVLL
jgi:hypothetical protein